jgi:UDP-N-acetylglucosamine acyltransferase
VAISIHSTAVVHPGAEIGEDVTVGPFSVIQDKTVIGAGTTIGSYCQVHAHTTMGRNNQIHSYAYVGGDPQDIKYRGGTTRLTMGDGNIVREFVTLHRGTETGRGETIIGSGCMIMAYAHVAHDCHIGDHVIMANGVMLAGHVDVGHHAVISGMSGVHQFARVGEFGFVGGMSGVSQDVPPFIMAAGVRAQLRGLNLIGLRRNGFSSEGISGLKKAYKLIWRAGKERQEALAEVQETLGAIPEVARLLEFIRSSERGMLCDIGLRNGQNRGE